MKDRRKKINRTRNVNSYKDKKKSSKCMKIITTICKSVIYVLKRKRMHLHSSRRIGNNFATRVRIIVMNKIGLRWIL